MQHRAWPAQDWQNSTWLASVTDAGIEHGIERVDDQVDQDIDEREQQNERLNHEIVPAQYRFDQDPHRLEQWQVCHQTKQPQDWNQ